jgi:hypothetical protein
MMPKHPSDPEGCGLRRVSFRSKPRQKVSKLFCKLTYEEIKIGDTRQTFRGQVVTVVGYWALGGASSGRVAIRYGDDTESNVYPQVIGAEIMEVDVVRIVK